MSSKKSTKPLPSLPCRTSSSASMAPSWPMAKLAVAKPSPCSASLATSASPRAHCKSPNDLRQEILDTKLDISISILEIYKDHIYDLI